jgi:hypothetical protein
MKIKRTLRLQPSLFFVSILKAIYKAPGLKDKAPGHKKYLQRE